MRSSTNTQPPKAQYVTTGSIRTVWVRVGTFRLYNEPVDTSPITCDDNREEDWHD